MLPVIRRPPAISRGAIAEKKAPRLAREVLGTRQSALLPRVSPKHNHVLSNKEEDDDKEATKELGCHEEHDFRLAQLKVTARDVSRGSAHNAACRASCQVVFAILCAISSPTSLVLHDRAPRCASSAVSTPSCSAESTAASTARASCWRPSE